MLILELLQAHFVLIPLFCVGLPPADAPKKISGVHKRCWRYIPNLPKIEGTQPETEAAWFEILPESVEVIFYPIV